MGLFKGKVDEEAVRAEIERLAALPVKELAAEILPNLAKEFDTDRIGRIKSPSTADIMTSMVGDLPASLYQEESPRERVNLGNELFHLIQDGVQPLLSASLACVHTTDAVGELHYLSTRAGRAAVERGNVAKLL